MVMPLAGAGPSITFRVSEAASLIVDSGLMRVSKVVEPAMPRKPVLGEALIVATVGKDGRVRSAKVSRADTSEMGSLALKAVRQWSFENGMGRQLEVPVKVIFDPTFDPYKRK